MKKYVTTALGLFVAFGILLSATSTTYAHHGRGGGHGGCYQNQGCLYDNSNCPYYGGNQRQAKNS